MHTPATQYFSRRFIFILVPCVSCAVANAQWTTSSGNIYNSNSGNVGVGTSTPQTLLDVSGLAAVVGTNANLGNAQVAAGSGSVGIGTQTPAAQFESLNSSLGSTGAVEMARFSAATPNYSQLRFTETRFASGSGWTTASTRIQAWTDASPQAFIDFNPNGAPAGVALGAGNTEAMRIMTGGNVLLYTSSKAISPKNTICPVLRPRRRCSRKASTSATTKPSCWPRSKSLPDRTKQGDAGLEGKDQNTRGAYPEAGRPRKSVPKS